MTASLLLLAVFSLATEPSEASRPRAEPATAPVTTRSAPAEAAAARYTLDEILLALRRVETGGERHGGRHAVGDGGVAIGPYQIQRAYWADSRVPGRYEDCRDPRYARAVVLAYWKRYCPKALEALDAQTLVRVHNGGPDGHREDCTLKFWRKIERELVKLREAAIKAKRAAPAHEPRPARTPVEKPMLV